MNTFKALVMLCAMVGASSASGQYMTQSGTQGWAGQSTASAPVASSYAGVGGLKSDGQMAYANPNQEAANTPAVPRPSAAPAFVQQPMPAAPTTSQMICSCITVTPAPQHSGAMACDGSDKASAPATSTGSDSSAAPAQSSYSASAAGSAQSSYSAPAAGSAQSSYSAPAAGSAQSSYSAPAAAPAAPSDAQSYAGPAPVSPAQSYTAQFTASAPSPSFAAPVAQSYSAPTAQSGQSYASQSSTAQQTAGNNGGY